MESLLSPKNDIVFKIFFSKPENSDLLISFLTAVLQPSSPILSVKVLNPEVPKDTAADKSVVLDVVAELDGNKKIDIEMQVDNRYNLRQRVLFYLSRLHQSQLVIGEEYRRISPTVSIAVLGYHETTETNFHSIYEMRERTSHSLFSEDLSVHLLELPKLHEFLNNNPETYGLPLSQWSRFFNLNNESELEALAMEKPIFKKAESALKSISGDPEARELARLREGARIHLGTALQGAEDFGLQRGIQQGIQQGSKEKAFEIAKRLLKIELSAPEISKVTGLSEKEILDLK